MVNIKKAITYVKEHGDEIEKARMKCILIGETAPKPIIQKLSNMQNPEGIFSYWQKDVSTIFDTVYILSWLDDLQVWKGKIIDVAFNFLISNQLPDGSWEEVTTEETKSSALTSGDIDAQVFLTAYCAHWFVRFGRAEPPGGKGSPVEFLQAHREPSGLILNDIQATWDSLVLFSYHPGLDSELFNETLEVIEKKLSPDTCKGSNLAYLLCCLRDAGLKAYHPFVNLCIDELIQKQQDDGSWEAEYGEEYTTNATIEALRGLKHYNVV